MATKDPNERQEQQERQDDTPFIPAVRLTDEELARLEQAHRAWDRPEVKHWLETGEWPAEDDGADDDE